MKVYILMKFNGCYENCADTCEEFYLHKEEAELQAWARDPCGILWYVAEDELHEERTEV